MNKREKSRGREKLCRNRRRLNVFALKLRFARASRIYLKGSLCCPLRSLYKFNLEILLLVTNTIKCGILK